MGNLAVKESLLLWDRTEVQELAGVAVDWSSSEQLAVCALMYRLHGAVDSLGLDR